MFHALPTALAALTAAAAPSQSPDVLVLTLGDSWSNFVAEPLQAVFDDAGHTGSVVVDAASGGSMASVLASPIGLAQISVELAQVPGVDYVLLSLGGNDFLTKWGAHLSAFDQALIYDIIEADVVAVVEHVRAEVPDARVVIQGYDYMNFVETLQADPGGACSFVWSFGMGAPSVATLNLAAHELEARKAAYAAVTPMVDYVDVFGLMQTSHGYPSLDLAPGDPSLPTTGLPTPPEALGNDGTDCIHLSPAGYDILARRVWQEVFAPHFADPWLATPVPGNAGGSNHFTMGAFPAATEVVLAASVKVDPWNLPGCPGLELALEQPVPVGSAVASPTGAVAFAVDLPASLSQMVVHWQAVSPTACVASPVVTTALP